MSSLPSSLLLYSQCFGWCILQLSSDVSCWTREPVWNFKPNPLIHRGSILTRGKNNKEYLYLVMVNGIRKFYPVRLNEEFGFKFHKDYRVQQETEGKQRTHRLKYCEYNKDEDNSLNMMNDKKKKRDRFFKTRGVVEVRGGGGDEMIRNK